MAEPVDASASAAALPGGNGTTATSVTNVAAVEGETETSMDVEEILASETGKIDSAVTNVGPQNHVAAASDAVSSVKDKLIMGLEQNIDVTGNFQSFFQPASGARDKGPHLSEEKTDDKDDDEIADVEPIETEEEPEPVTLWSMPSNCLTKCPVIFKPTGDDDESRRLANARQEEFSSWGGEMKWVVVEEVDIEIEERVRVAVPHEEAQGPPAIEEAKMDSGPQPAAHTETTKDVATDDKADSVEQSGDIAPQTLPAEDEPESANDSATSDAVAAPAQSNNMGTDETGAAASESEGAEVVSEPPVAASETPVLESALVDAVGERKDTAPDETLVTAAIESEALVPVKMEEDDTAVETDTAPIAEASLEQQEASAALDVFTAESETEAAVAASAAESEAAPAVEYSATESEVAPTVEDSAAEPEAAATEEAMQQEEAGSEAHTKANDVLPGKELEDAAAEDNTVTTDVVHEEGANASNDAPSSPGTSRSLRRRTKITTYNISKLMEANTMRHLDDDEVAVLEAKKASKPKFKFILQKKIIKETRIRPATEEDFLHNLKNIRIQVSFTNASSGQRKSAKKTEKKIRRSTTSTSASSSSAKKKKRVSTTPSSSFTSSLAKKKKKNLSVSATTAKPKKVATPRSTTSARNTSTPKSATARSTRLSAGKGSKKKDALRAGVPTKTLPARKVKSPVKHKTVTPAPGVSSSAAKGKKKLSTTIPTALPTKMELCSMKAPEPELRDHKGWIRKEFLRQNGSTAGITDKYWISPKPDCFKFRSMVQVKKYLECLEETKGDAKEAFDIFKQG